jgi:hypothetical protein
MKSSTNFGSCDPPAARFDNGHALLPIFLATPQPAPSQVEPHDHSAIRLTVTDVSRFGVLYCESRKDIAQTRDEGCPSRHAARPLGRIEMFDFDMLRQHRREGCAFANPITKRAPQHSCEDGNVWFKRRHAASYLAYLVHFQDTRQRALPDDMSANANWPGDYLKRRV